MISSILFIITLSVSQGQVDYETQIQTIFNNSCTSCHLYGHNSGLNLTTYATTMSGGNNGLVIAAGDHANSELYNRITLPETANGDMPPTGSLSQSDIDLIAQWIDEGALEVPAVEVDTPDIVINEFLAGSENCCGSDIFDGNTEDFVELYNYGTEPININGWGFSDTDGIITTTAPDTSIAPGNFLVLWYTGDNNGFPEINEKLSSDGEAIYIADADGNPMIRYDFGSQTDDVSYGRYPDGSDFWETMHPTPGQSNMTNASPGDFSLIFPLESDTLTTALVNQSDSLIFLDSIMFEWEESIDPDGNDIHYVFRLSIQCCGEYDMWSILDTLDVNNNSISYSSLYVILEGMFEQPMLFSTPHHINWGVKAIDGIDETTEITNSFYVIFNDYLDIDNEIIPKYFTVFPAYPNPFNPVTTLSYLIPIDGFVDVTIFDMMGRVIKNLVRSKQSYGYKSIKWNATDNQNQVVPAGVYVYKIEFGKFVSTRKMILLK